MKLSELESTLGCRSLWDGWKDADIEGAYCSDLLSDVMAGADEGYLLITIQAHKNTVAVAVLKDISGILIANNRPVPPDMIEAARVEGIPVFVTGDNQYRTSWRLHEVGGF